MKNKTEAGRAADPGAARVRPIRTPGPAGIRAAACALAVMTVGTAAVLAPRSLFSRGASDDEAADQTLYETSVPEETLSPAESPVPAVSLTAGSSSEPSEPTPEPTPMPEPTPTPRPSYSIPEGSTAGYDPDPALFGSFSCDEAWKMRDVIYEARQSGLLGEDEALNFALDLDFDKRQDIRYYLDDSIFAVCWWEYIDGKTCSMCEVKIADASQFRRKLADDTFGAKRHYLATVLSAQTNAVVSMNADFYSFRDGGVVVYDRELMRYNTGKYSRLRKYNCIDTLCVTESGDFIFLEQGFEMSEEELRQWLDENRVNFSVAFGPVIVKDGEAVLHDSYPLGEANQGYSRAGIGQVGPLHYLYMTLDHAPHQVADWTVNTFAEHFAEKNVQNAYTLDGGQTGELLINAEVYNFIDFGAERTVSDILYFATAVDTGTHEDPAEGAEE